MDSHFKLAYEITDGFGDNFALQTGAKSVVAPTGGGEPTQG